MMISTNVLLWSCNNSGQCGQVFTVSVSCTALSDFTWSCTPPDTRKARDYQEYVYHSYTCTLHASVQNSFVNDNGDAVNML